MSRDEATTPSQNRTMTDRGPHSRRRRRLRRRVGLAAGLVIAASLGACGAESDPAPTSASTASQAPLPSRPGVLSAADRATVLDRMDDALRRHGTLSVTMTPAGSTPTTPDSGVPIAGTVFELDVRDPAVTRWRAGGTSSVIRDDAWPTPGLETSPPPAPTRRTDPSPSFARHGRTLLAFAWAPRDADRVVVIGDQASESRPLVQYQFVSIVNDNSETGSPDPGRDDGRDRLDVWVAADGAIVRATATHDGVKWHADPVTYGADVTIAPPPSRPAYGSASATGP